MNYFLFVYLMSSCLYLIQIPLISALGFGSIHLQKLWLPIDNLSGLEYVYVIALLTHLCALLVLSTIRHCSGLANFHRDVRSFISQNLPAPMMALACVLLFYFVFNQYNLSRLEITLNLFGFPISIGLVISSLILQKRKKFSSAFLAFFIFCILFFGLSSLAIDLIVKTHYLSLMHKEYLAYCLVGGVFLVSVNAVIIPANTKANVWPIVVVPNILGGVFLLATMIFFPVLKKSPLELLMHFSPLICAHLFVVSALLTQQKDVE